MADEIQPGTEPTDESGGFGLEELEQEQQVQLDEQGNPVVETPEESEVSDEDALIEKITKRWEETARPMLEQRQAQPPKQYSQDELDEMFKVYKPKDVGALMKAFREGDEVAFTEAILGLRDGLTTQMATLMEYTLQAKLAEVDQKYGGFASEAQRAQAEREEKDFYTTNKDLTNHKKVVALVFNQLQSDIQNKRRAPFANKVAATKAVADEVRAVLKEQGVSIGTNRPANPPRRMAPLARPGGTGGPGNRGGSAPTAISAQLRELA